MYKICTRCRKEYENVDNNFHKCYRNTDGYNKICKYCNLERKHLHKHIDQNKNLLCLKCNVYKSENDFDINKNKWYRLYKDTRCKKCKLEQRKKRLILNRGDLGIERLIIERFCGLKDRAKRNNLNLDFTKEYLRELWEKQDHKCAISGIEMTTVMFNGRTPTNISVDRIDSSKGYIKGNVQLVCMAVNQMKSDLSKEELLYFCEKIIENEKKNTNSRSS